MGLFEDIEVLKRRANLCHLLISKVPEEELMRDYQFYPEEIAVAKKNINTFDDYAYLQGKVRKSLRKWKNYKI